MSLEFDESGVPVKETLEEVAERIRAERDAEETRTQEMLASMGEDALGSRQGWRPCPES